MRRSVAVVAGLLLALALPTAARAADPPAGAAMSDGLEYVTKLPGTETAVDGNFDRVLGRRVMVVTGRFGLRTYDLTDPDAPRLLDSFMPPGVLGERGYWEDEDVDLDRRRKLIIASLDPRHDDVDQAACPGVGTLAAKTRNPACRSGFYVISYANPGRLRQVGDFVELPAGHTSTCIDRCRWVWTGGPARRDDLAYLGPFTPGGRGDGRPIWVTDLRDATRPEVLGQPIDLWRNDGATDYSHDVQVDASGIAWTSGRGGVLGYATAGRHRDPRTNLVRRATPADPVLVAGGGVAGTSSPNQFMHNSLRPMSDAVRAEGLDEDDVLIGTEEEFGGTTCREKGRIVFSDLRSSYGGEGATGSTPEAPFRMPALSTFHPADDTPETLAPGTSCSAHYFDLAGSVLATTWYGQGMRLLDVADARAPRQIAYFRVAGTDAVANPSSVAFSVKQRFGRLYLFDQARGVEVLRLRAGAAGARSLPAVVAPSLGDDPLASRVVASAAADGFVCPLFTDSPAARAAKAR
jgi:hypothetical protein